RLAVLLTHRRNPSLEPQVELLAEGDKLTLSIDAKWLEANPLTAAELEIESNRQADIGWPLTITAC
ncbi:guanosine-5'-triphosphate,3'-diphosphate pyrophosphatase, partial [Escherichia coli]|nr:guanosine-5'-triphosphate,3'-diphosphate pyrophosphatase [Escherichia coli]